MLMLPPISPGGKVERRVRARRASDAQYDRREPAVDPAPAAEPEAGPQRRTARSGGRRASDRQAGQEQAAPAASASAARAPRAYAPLVAQLIANALGLEQTRARRRGTVAEATELYRRKRDRPRRSRGEA